MRGCIKFFTTCMMLISLDFNSGWTLIIAIVMFNARCALEKIEV